MIKLIKQYIKENRYELLTTFFLFTNLYAFTFPSWMYFIGVGMIAYKFNKYAVRPVGKWQIIAAFLGAVWFSTIINAAFDLRPILFTLIVLSTSPYITSPAWHLYKKKLMRNIFIGFAVTVVVSVYAKATGVNYQIYRYGGSMVEYGGIDEFCGFAKFPMWNSAAAAMSTMYFTYLLLQNKTANKKLKAFFLVMLFTSFYVCLISSSRTAAAFSVLSCACMFKWLTHKFQKMLQYGIIIGGIGIFLMPLFTEGAARMLQKQETQNVTGVTSRDELWAKRAEEFASSPLYGVGYAVSGVGAGRNIGRDESGSSWYAILAQTGIIGFVIALMIWVKSYTGPKWIQYDEFNLLVLATLLFFTLHSIFEGYMFQGGWYMCVICWMCVGIVNEAKMYRKQLCE